MQNPMELFQFVGRYLDDFSIVGHQAIDLDFDIRRLRVNTCRDPLFAKLVQASQ
jgi:hypothetical protein